MIDAKDIAIALLLTILALSVTRSEAEPLWWVWVKHPGDMEWVVFAPAVNYTDCMSRLLPKTMGYFEGRSAWQTPRFKCEVKK